MSLLRSKNLPYICPAIAPGLAVDTGCTLLIERTRVNPS